MKTTGSSQIAAVMDLSNWTTRWQLYQEAAHGIKAPDDEDERMRMGVFLEPHIIAEACDDRGWSFEWNGPTATDALGTSLLHRSDPRASARPDALAHDPARPGLPGNLECKLVNIFRFWDTWGRDDPTPPIEIELQWQWQSYVAGTTWGAIIVYVMGGDEWLVFPREPDPDVIAAMLEANHLFWQQVEQRNEPDPFGDPKELPILALKYPTVQDEKPQDLGTNEEAAQIFADYQLCQKKTGLYKKQADGLKAQLLGLTADNKTTFVQANDGTKFRVNVSKSISGETLTELPVDMQNDLRYFADGKMDAPHAGERLGEIAEWAEVKRKSSISTRVTVKELETGDAADAPQSTMEAG